MSNVRMWPVESADALSPLQRRHAPAGTSSEDLIHFGPFSLSPTTHILQDAGGRCDSAAVRSRSCCCW